MAECAHPEAYTNPATGQRYCLPCVYDEARQKCIDKGEGWRWGVGERPRQPQKGI